MFRQCMLLTVYTHCCGKKCQVSVSVSKKVVCDLIPDITFGNDWPSNVKIQLISRLLYLSEMLPLPFLTLFCRANDGIHENWIIG